VVTEGAFFGLIREVTNSLMHRHLTLAHSSTIATAPFAGGMAGRYQTRYIQLNNTRMTTTTRMTKAA
jgi:hypothetical protein